MWFKNLVIYRLDRPVELNAEQIGSALATQAWRPCGGLEPFSYGWAPPLGRLGSELVHAAAGAVLVCVRREDRLLPPAVVREEVESRVAGIEETHGRSVGSKERRKIRDQVTFELMPRAFTRSTHAFAYLVPKDGWLVVDAASTRRAEDLVTLLGSSLEELAAEPWEPGVSPATLMTRWLEGDPLPEGFSLQHDCELRDPAEEGAVVRCQRQDLRSDEIAAHLRAGKQVHRLGLGFEERVSLVLGADLTIRRLRFEAVEELDDTDSLDEAARFDANFAFMTGELERLLGRLDAVFGTRARP